jgi:hypothetical protein
MTRMLMQRQWQQQLLLLLMKLQGLLLHLRHLLQKMHRLHQQGTGKVWVPMANVACWGCKVCDTVLPP